VLSHDQQQQLLPELKVRRSIHVRWIEARAAQSQTFQRLLALVEAEVCVAGKGEKQDGFEQLKFTR
jgi:hypothetical protein